jgi:hypothetical protein
MLRQIPQPPKTERRFAGGWDELAYLCNKTSYWLYTRGQRAYAERYLERLEQVLRGLPKNDFAIVREEGAALAAELNGRISDSIRHRKREIELMERLHKDARSQRYSDETRSYMLRGRGADALRSRRAILESLKEQVAAE